MQEKDLNTKLTHNFKNYGFSYKIADVTKAEATSSIKRPFDGLSAICGKSLYYETKFLKGYQSFNFNKIEDHQIYRLTEINNNSYFSYPIIILGIWESRKFLDLMFFHISTITNLQNEGKNSILKKELLKIKESGKHLTIIKNIFDVSDMFNKVLYVSELKRILNGK